MGWSADSKTALIHRPRNQLRASAILLWERGASSVVDIVSQINERRAEPVTCDLVVRPALL